LGFSATTWEPKRNGEPKRSKWFEYMERAFTINFSIIAEGQCQSYSSNTFYALHPITGTSLWRTVLSSNSKYFSPTSAQNQTSVTHYNKEPHQKLHQTYHLHHFFEDHGIVNGDLINAQMFEDCSLSSCAHPLTLNVVQMVKTLQLCCEILHVWLSSTEESHRSSAVD